MKKITILLLTAAAMASGCKRFTDINQNPNQPTSVTPNVVLSAALNASAASIGTDFFNTNEWMGYWSRSGNYIAVIPTEQYQISTGYADGDFQNLYGTLSKYHYIETTALANTATLAFYAGVAKTMKAVHFSNLVDGFGNIPYSQAFQINKYPTPGYDDAQTIYTNLISQLDSASYYFGVAATYYSSASSTVKNLDDKYDIMFGRGLGTSPSVRMAKWTAFANTVELKLLMNEVLVTQASYINGEIAKMNANGAGYLTPGLSASVNPGYTSSTQAQLNPFYGQFYTNGGSAQGNNNFYRANTYAVNFYNANSDPRIGYVYTTPFLGSNYDGDPNSVPNSGTSGIGAGLTQSPSQDQLIMSDFEGLFVQAEAAARGFNVGNDANTLLQEAIEQNFIYLGDTAADADTYYTGSTSPNVNFTVSVGTPVPSTSDQTKGLQAIITQKWIALNGINWFQAYTDYRRTGFPLSSVLSISHANAHVKNAIPYRFLYPQSEYDTNGKNVPTLANAQYTPIFWDKLQN
jgi:hypothetical protein